ncbi:DUF1992 domain-containing protein [Subtercola boreus]|uniref:Molecular chaperone DnaJ n=1 Tax=Subtercola boreus TaxID=120213 RepID=A0A3E0W7M6_9MICO|nr:DUF1992 domain-containing protein [Subtercola boreus]RFA19085.1 molecular chaperone DnaJ [Subtercola boreus]RFA19223.1 molecular chaperone DnaJ [Subtercola boreus]RFA25685.1 molecular chaperone DnaJ [Subtercola boreus]
MSERKKRSDARLNVARYRVDGSLPAGEQGAESAEAADDDTALAGQRSMEARAQFVEISIQQAMRRGEFDNLPGAGKPLRNLHDAYDPNWWIKQKIERENITGLGPPALTLRSENAELDGRLDAAPSEKRVRELLADFNARVVEARRQLKGGPPVVTPPRDVEAEVQRWHERRNERYRAAQEQRAADEAAFRALSWRDRRRARRTP